MIRGVSIVAAMLLCGSARAEQERFGLFIASNAGAGGREPLQHAEADAARLRSVFVELGGMPEENAVLIERPDAARILTAIRALAPRIAAAPQALFIFYYSGHADDRALLLGDSELALADLRHELESVPAQLYLQIVDACRSGALTRAKGARAGAPFSVASTGLGEGRVVITSSAEWEDAQESDRLGGSFFTFHLASGLRGAADADNDGTVTLAEAYTYVYGRTVESTLATAAGPQHPTFRYDMRGRGELILTRSGGRESGILALEGNGDYLVVDASTGRIAAEVRTKPSGDKLSLRPGDYRVSKRTGTAVLEGSLRLEPRATIVADPLLTERVAHARLVRKGAASSLASHAFRFETGLRGPLGRGIGSAAMLRGSYILALPWLSLKPRASFGFPATVLTPRLSYAVRELELGLEASHSFDLEELSLGIGLAGDVLVLQQRARSGTEAPRDAIGFVAGAVFSVESRPWNGFSLAVTTELDAYSFPVTDSDRSPISEKHLHTALTYRLWIGVGYEL